MFCSAMLILVTLDDKHHLGLKSEGPDTLLPSHLGCQDLRIKIKLQISFKHSFCKSMNRRSSGEHSVNLTFSSRTRQSTQGT